MEAFDCACMHLAAGFVRLPSCVWNDDNEDDVMHLCNVTATAMLQGTNSTVIIDMDMHADKI